MKKLYLDCTVGLGGHTEAILAATGPEGRVVGLDRDEEALALAEKRLRPYRDRIILRKSSFKELSNIAAELPFERGRWSSFRPRRSLLFNWIGRSEDSHFRNRVPSICG
ncbi:MAG: 16S rRNA (cytosine(1402)-N(4))-methyltransferase [Candidatus Manganitrophus sp.]|nr:16S rRNA (cytosine(1402)-N(4))-methyltransferase [Candidatus Manganitrophus sp.]